jgi:hypothetical protein
VRTQLDWILVLRQRQQDTGSGSILVQPSDYLRLLAKGPKAPQGESKQMNVVAIAK